MRQYKFVPPLRMCIYITLLTFSLSNLNGPSHPCKFIQLASDGCLMNRHLSLTLSTGFVLQLRGGQARGKGDLSSTTAKDNPSDPLQSVQNESEIESSEQYSSEVRAEQDATLSDADLLSLGRNFLDSKDFSGAAAYFSHLVERQVCTVQHLGVGGDSEKRKTLCLLFIKQAAGLSLKHITGSTARRALRALRGRLSALRDRACAGSGAGVLCPTCSNAHSRWTIATARSLLWRFDCIVLIRQEDGNELFGPSVPKTIPVRAPVPSRPHRASRALLLLPAEAPAESMHAPGMIPQAISHSPAWRCTRSPRRPAGARQGSAS